MYIHALLYVRMCTYVCILLVITQCMCMSMSINECVGLVVITCLSLCLSLGVGPGPALHALVFAWVHVRKCRVFTACVLACVYMRVHMKQVCKT